MSSFVKKNEVIWLISFQDSRFINFENVLKKNVVKFYKHIFNKIYTC